MREHGIREIHTTDTDFLQFPEIKVIHPLHPNRPKLEKMSTMRGHWGLWSSAVRDADGTTISLFLSSLGFSRIHAAEGSQCTMLPSPGERPGARGKADHVHERVAVHVHDCED